VGGPAKRAAGTEQFLAIVNVAKLHAEAGAIAEVFFDHLAEVSETEDDFAEAVAVKKIELVIDEGLAGQLNQGFGDFLCERAEARGQAAGQEGDGDILDFQSSLAHRSRWFTTKTRREAKDV